MNDNGIHFVTCEMCGKRLIERKANGMWHFAFGRCRDENGILTGQVPVDIYIYGSLKIKCLRRRCGHWNVLNYFPFAGTPELGVTAQSDS
jgi:hypothetical protein